MSKKVLLYTLLFLIFLPLGNFIFSEDNTNDLANKTLQTLEGKISRQTTVWRVDFSYGDKKIGGEFNRPAPVRLPKNRYKIEFEINDKLYKGSIYYFIPLFQSNRYEVDLDCDDILLTGEIERNYKKVYKKDEFNLRYDKTRFNGSILYDRKADGKNFNLAFGGKRITGKMFTESRGIKSIKKINLRFDDKKLLGSIERGAGYEKYTLRSDELTDEDLFLFFFLMIYLEIDEYNEEIKDQ